MGKYVILLLTAMCALTASAFAGDPVTTQQLIVGSWYCPSTDGFHRFDFGGNGSFLWSSYIPLKGKLRFWSSNYTGPATYAVKSPTEIQIGSAAGPSEIRIRSVSKDDLTFVWFDTSYACTHTSPPGDTPETRAAAAAELQKQKESFLGKWVATTAKEYVEFLPNDVCVRGTLQGGRWVTTRDTSDVAHEGSDAECGGAGLYSRSGPNTIVLDFGMGGETTTFRRATTTATKK